MASANATGAPCQEVHGLDSPKLRLIRIEVLVLVGAGLLSLLLLFGSHRRRSSSAVLKGFLLLASTVNYPLLSYTIGLMQSSPFRNDLFVVWAVLWLILYTSTDSFSAYSLEEHEQWIGYLALHLMQLFWVAWLFFKIGNHSLSRPLAMLLIVLELKLTARARSFRARSRLWIMRLNSLVALYMTYEHELSNPNEIDPVHMRGYKYLLTRWHWQPFWMHPPDYMPRVPLGSWATVEDVWQCRGRLLDSKRGDPGGRLKDICLSRALYHLLLRRFSDHPLGESNMRKTRDFVLKGMLSKEMGYERAFRVIEVELAFLFDLFYTNYLPQNDIVWGIFHDFSSLLLFFPACWLAKEVLTRYQNPSIAEFNLITVYGKNVDALVTFVVILVIAILPAVQLVASVSADKLKVLLLSYYVMNPSWQNRWQENFIGFVCQRQRMSKPWENKIGQYELLNPCNYSRLKTIVYKGINLCCDTTLTARENSPTMLPVEAKKEIAFSLIANEGQPCNGVSSLQRNGLREEFSWACDLETQPHVRMILVWHIATTLCSIAPSDVRDQEEQEVVCYQRVAVSVSKYCGYLVAFAPELLPDHSETTRSLLYYVEQEVQWFLDGCPTMRNRYDRMMELAAMTGTDEDSVEEGSTTPETIVEKGARLGKQLIEQIKDERQRWKVLAEFWAELMIFLAPSDNATAHAQHLANGGEFITHLWALLTHAGIVERPKNPPPAKQQPPENPRGHAGTTPQSRPTLRRAASL